MTTSKRTLRRAAAAVGATATMALAAGPFVGTAGASAGQAPSPCPTATTANQKYVTYVFDNILGRAYRTMGACSIDQGALTYWSSKLDAGLSRAKFTEAVDTSTENVRLNAEDLYGGILDRAPTAAEAKAVADHIRTEHEDGRIIAHIIASDEYFENMTDTSCQVNDPSTSATTIVEQPSDEQVWLDNAYCGILDRAPDPAGNSYWLGQLGSPSTVASRESVARRLERTNENAQGWVAGIYFASLQRPPDDAGFGYWVNYLQTTGKWQTFRLYTNFLATNEAYAMAQNPPQMDQRKTSRDFPTQKQVQRLSPR